MSFNIIEKQFQINKRNERNSKEIDINYLTKIIYCLGILIRIITYYYGLWQDNNLNVKFTDIDYYVFSDAAKYVLSKKSPYNRYTYRYTPILAYLMVPNFWVHHSFGKILFSSIDFLVSIIITKIINIKYPECKNYIYYVLLWILNPLVIVISIRGNADCIPCLLVMITVLCIYQKKIFLSSIFYGLAVNFKIYPIIYSLPLMLYLNKNYLSRNKIFHLKKKSDSLLNCIININYIIYQFFIELFKLNYNQLVFSFCSFFVFLILNIIFYIIYGYEFLYESCIYHLVRRDHRHNFSLFFYIMYLSIEKSSKIIPLITFIPQMILVGILGIRYAKTNLDLSMFLQTVAFIAMNKVCTSQVNIRETFINMFNSKKYGNLISILLYTLNTLHYCIIKEIRCILYIFYILKKKKKCRLLESYISTSIFA